MNEFKHERNRTIKRERAADKIASNRVELAGERAFSCNAYLPIINLFQTELS